MTGYQNGAVCPLLRYPDSYRPDLVDLGVDEKERDYWLPCLEQLVKKFVSKAKTLNPDDARATEKAEICYEQFRELVEKLRVNPSLMNPLSVRTLLEYHENTLRANDLKDAYSLQKSLENELAFKEFDERLRRLDAIEDFAEKWEELARGVIAGNVFDWGAKAVADILESAQRFGLKEALETIEKRPWFQDKLDEWIARMKKQPYECCTIFMDNSGVDLILGIFPLARELLSLGTRVILTANTAPSLNDVTFNELNLCCCKASQYCNIFKESIRNGRLITVANGQKGPCLDLSKLTPELCELMKSTDLVILEGMGRAIHTNFHAKFKVDSVKMAVLKNEHLAKSLGANQFGVVCDFEQASLE